MLPRSKITACVVVAAALALLQPVAANADGPWDEVRAGFAELGVDPLTVDSLVAKLELGETLDSLSGAAPVSTEVSSVDGYLVERSTYADGSVSTTSVEDAMVIPPGQEATMAGISGCTVTGSGLIFTYNSCHIDHSTVIINGSFTATYRINQSAADSILSVSNPLYSCFAPASCSNRSVVINRATESGSSKAEAELTFEVSGYASGVAHLWLRVGSNTATATGQF